MPWGTATARFSANTVSFNDPLIEQLARYAREARREIATPVEARQLLRLLAKA